MDTVVQAMRSTPALVLCVAVAATAAAAEPSAPYQVQGLDIYRHVIAYKTEVGRHQVPVMARYLVDKFRAAGFAEQDIHVLPLGETASLIVRYRGDGTGGKPVLAMAHMDVVTARPEDWRRDPFTLTQEGGFFFGRGALDVKVGVACITETFLRLKAEGFVPTRDLILVFTGDEETSQNTTMDLAHRHRDLIDAEFALNSDAGGGTLDEGDGHAIVYGLQNAEKAYASFELTVRNPGGHSSLPRADNAIYELADALEKLRGFRFPVMWNDSTREYFRVVGARTPGELGAAMSRFAVNPQDRAADDTLNADANYVGVTRTTCVPTLLRGGHADNALPQSATVTMNCRIYPGVAPEKIQTALQSVVGSKVEIKLAYPVISGPSSPIRPDVLAAVTTTVHSLYPDVPVVPKQESGASDGSVFRSVGIPTYGVSEVFIKDSDDFAHGLNERLPVKSFYDGLEFWYVLLKQVAAPKPPAG
jgi:acetylornithine deacetylase/succinyl-diaminopimelate desuccinylase-like protein